MSRDHHPRAFESLRTAAGSRTRTIRKHRWSAKDPAKTTAWVGYKLQLAETVSNIDNAKSKGDPTEQFITEVTTTEAIASDIDGMKRNLRAQAEYHEEAPAELYVDAAYVTDNTMAEARAQGREIIGPARPAGNPTHRLDADQFDVDVADRKAVCPAGHISRRCSRITDNSNGSVCLRFEWAGLCDDCPCRSNARKAGPGGVSWWSVFITTCYSSAAV